MSHTPIIQSSTPVANTRYQHLKTREKNLYERLATFETVYDLETRVEEKLRLKHLIDQTHNDIADVQRQLALLGD